MWQPGRILVFGLDNLVKPSIIGKIRAPVRSSITAIGTVFDLNEPFLTAGHSNGDITWFQARCGTCVRQGLSFSVFVIVIFTSFVIFVVISRFCHCHFN